MAAHAAGDNPEIAAADGCAARRQPLKQSYGKKKIVRSRRFRSV
jgi:hypothetical protein